MARYLPAEMLILGLKAKFLVLVFSGLSLELSALALNALALE